MNEIVQNHEFELAYNLINFTGNNIFLTGKAGTGKTTFLKYLVSNSLKKIVVTAPTGVAAINAGGVTLHSMFFLPFQAFIPTYSSVDRNIAINKHELIRTLRLSNTKKEVIRDMELLIIDEISMVRADLLDAVDTILKHIRGNKEQFGGVQVLMIGDLYQLPPIVKPHEMELLSEYYQSQYFFDSEVLTGNLPLCIELRKVYRQSNKEFIKLLNNIRNQTITTDDLELISSRYIPGYEANEEGWITISTHNQSVNNINQRKLEKLSSKSHKYKATIKGNFPESMYPISMEIELKEGAQVMFIKNDPSPDKAYYNGKLAKVSRLEQDDIYVKFLENDHEYKLSKEIWRNVEYVVNNESGEIVENELGLFEQFPIKLAWAITVHKSQGLTFDRVVIDLGRAFAPGQVYVAMSRCRSIDGVVLVSTINQNLLFSDSKVLEFHDNISHIDDLFDIYDNEKYDYALKSIKASFDMNDLLKTMTEWKSLILSKKIPNKENVLELNESVLVAINDLIHTNRGLFKYINENYPDNWDKIIDKTRSAIPYYIKSLLTNVSSPLEAHFLEYSSKSKLKQYLNHYADYSYIIKKTIDRIRNITIMGDKLYKNTRPIKLSNEVENISQKSKTVQKSSVSTYKQTLDLLNEGKSIQEISKIRNLAESTIFSHICKYIEDGTITEIDRYIDSTKLEFLKEYIKKNSIQSSLSELKSGLDSSYSYNDIKIVKALILRDI